MCWGRRAAASWHSCWARPIRRYVASSSPTCQATGCGRDSETPAWTLKGEPLPRVPGNFTAADLKLSGRDRFLKRLQEPTAVARAEIQVERIGGPVPMFSGKDDQLRPSDIFAARIPSVTATGRWRERGTMRRERLGRRDNCQPG